jgi:hypothetical protein
MDAPRAKDIINNITKAVNKGFLGKEEQIRLAVCAAFVPVCIFL